MVNKIVWIALLMIFINTYGFTQTIKYPQSVEKKTILTGDNDTWDEGAVHTFSVVETNNTGFKYFAYYGLDYYNDKNPAVKKCGLAMSNNLVDWVKYKQNPIIDSNCRWPTVVYSNNNFYMFYAEYNQNGDSRIVMRKSKNGIDFGNKSVVVSYQKGVQNQNPFIYYNEKDKNYYLFYYNGTERATSHPEWNIKVKKSKTIATIVNAKSQLVLTSDKTMAAPSVAFYNGTYYLLVEEFENFEKMDKWVTNAFWSKHIDKGYQRVTNNPVLANNDACAFQYIFNGKLYVFYSHSINLAKSKWDIEMIKLK